MQFLRVALGFLAIFFAYALGRVATRLRSQDQSMTKALPWVLRTAVTLLAIVWTRGFDAVGIVTLGLAVFGFIGGIYMEIRPRRTEETHLFDR
jgi:hypothetical protein